MQLAEPIVIGRIVGVFGVRGWLKVHSYTDPKAKIFSYSPWLIHQQGQWQPVTLVAKHSGNMTVKMTGVDDREQARQWVGRDISISRQQLPPLGENEYYWCDLQGLTVINQHGTILGVVERLMETGANDVLIIRQPDQQELLIPYQLGGIVETVDLRQQQLRVDWPLDNKP